MINLITLYFLALMIYSLFRGRSEENALYCGLSGFNLDKPLMEPTIPKILTIDNVARGIHATGVATPTSLSKDVIRAEEFMQDFSNENFEVSSGFTHTRHATMGNTKNKEEAHPFKIEDDNKGVIIGMHNGWLIKNSRRNEMDYVAKKYSHDIANVPVDSMLIYKHIMSKDPSLKETAEAISEIEGAMALIWYDRRPGVLSSLSKSKDKSDVMCVYRRESKPLFRVKYKNWGSEGFFFSSRVEGLKIAGFSNEDIEEVPENIIWVYRDGKVIEKIEVECPEIDINLNESPTDFNSRFVSNSARYKKFYTIEEPRKEISFPSRNKNRKGSSNELKQIPLFSRDKRPGCVITPYSPMSTYGNYLCNFKNLNDIGYLAIKPHLSPDDNGLAQIISHKVSECLSRDSLIFVSLTDNEKPLRGWRVLIDGYPNSLSVTKENGVCALYVPNELRDNSNVKVTIHPPAGYYIKIDKSSNRFECMSFIHMDLLEVVDGHAFEVNVNIDFEKIKSQCIEQGKIACLEKLSNTMNKFTDISKDKSRFTQLEKDNDSETHEDDELPFLEDKDEDTNKEITNQDIYDTRASSGGPFRRYIDSYIDININIYFSNSKRNDMLGYLKSMKESASKGASMLFDKSIDRMKINKVYSMYLKDVEALLSIFQSSYSNITCANEWQHQWYEMSDNSFSKNRIEIYKVFAMTQCLYDIESIIEHLNDGVEKD